MRTFSLWSAVFAGVLAAACGGGPTSPSAALSAGASENLPNAVRSLDEIAAVRPAARATNLNLKGIVSAVDADALTITVNSGVINVPATATIVDALDAPLTFADISVGKRVHVSGKTVDGASTASVVRVLDWAVAGTVTGLAGTCPALTFTVDDRDVATTATTEFSRGDCTKVADDLQVEVQGTIDEAGLLTALRVVLPRNAPKSTSKATNLNLKGIVGAIDADALTITVSSTVIKVPATAKIVDALNAALTFADITVGKRVHVNGKTVDSVSTASAVRVLDWAVAGTVTALDGTCPALTFTVDGQNVATTATTEFSRGDCTKLADDLQVEVHGTIDAGVLTAVRVVLPKTITPKPPKTVSVQGSISLASGACPAMIFTVAGQEVRTDASTIFTGPGKCPAVTDGKIADVTGVQETDHIRAVRVKVRK